MRKLIIGGLIVVLIGSQSIKANQEVPTELPPLELDLGLVIDILADYEIRHDQSGLMHHLQYYGLTANKTIFVDGSYEIFLRKWTLLHELYHIAYRRKGLQTVGPNLEQQIDTKAYELARQLYSQ